MEKKLYRSNTDYKIAGVCGGIARFFDIDPTIVRLAFVLFGLHAGTGILVYFVAALIMPYEDEI